MRLRSAVQVAAAVATLGVAPMYASGCSRLGPEGDAVPKEAAAASPSASSPQRSMPPPASAPQEEEGPASAPQEEEAPALPKPSGARCGAMTCRGHEPSCCLEGASQRGACMSEAELDENCTVDGAHFQLRCGHPSDCPTGSHCCIFNQMSQCGFECAHLGQMCERDDECTALAQVTGQPARCLPLEGGPTQFSVCQVE